MRVDASRFPHCTNASATCVASTFVGSVAWKVIGTTASWVSTPFTVAVIGKRRDPSMMRPGLPVESRVTTWNTGRNPMMALAAFWVHRAGERSPALGVAAT